MSVSRIRGGCQLRCRVGESILLATGGLDSSVLVLSTCIKRVLKVEIEVPALKVRSITSPTKDGDMF